jgi:probable phosphoglycerate mutase
MTTIYLMRHGESVVNIEHRLTCHRLEGDLTRLGREQASRAASWLRGKGITHVRASPFHRAQQTAEIIAETLSVEVVTDSGLAEMDCGSLEGRVDDAAWHDWTEVYERWKAHDLTATFPDGESFGDAVTRFRQTLDNLPDGSTAMLVTHGGITRTVVPYVAEVSAELLYRGDLANTGIAVLEYVDEGYRCSSWNLMDHLSDLNPAEYN